MWRWTLQGWTRRGTCQTGARGNRPQKRRGGFHLGTQILSWVGEGNRNELWTFWVMTEAHTGCYRSAGRKGISIEEMSLELDLERYSWFHMTKTGGCTQGTVVETAWAKLKLRWKWIWFPEPTFLSGGRRAIPRNMLGPGHEPRGFRSIIPQVILVTTDTKNKIVDNVISVEISRPESKFKVLPSNFETGDPGASGCAFLTP